MLSYQHIYHAGNLADLHKHALLAWVLMRMAQKPKPLTYIETHAGRGVYDLEDPHAHRTGEARAGILRAEAEGWLPPDHPLILAIARIRDRYGASTYPGSPAIAAMRLPRDCPMHLAELHPQEHAALAAALAPRAHVQQRDGFEMAHALCPPTPRRGVLLIDPSYEVKQDYTRLPGLIARITRKWNVGVIMLWYPILTSGRHQAMVAALHDEHPGLLVSEVGFAPARDGHAMIGSGLAVINPPWGLADEAARIEAIFAARAGTARAGRGDGRNG